MNEWKDIKDAPVGKRMIVVRAFNISVMGKPYTSDPYCVWQPKRMKFERWPHSAFKPTHFCELPEPPK